MKAIVKRIVFVQLIIVAFAANTVASNINTGEKVTTTFKVYGNCEMCKEKIENSLQIRGITYAEWDIETKELTVTYKPDKITLEEIHKAINKIGYDTDQSKALDDDNKKLPQCCQREGAH